eukprot:CAMPEP_0194313078 /NCGR_PEP_ID=MMETSP0171-20130528/9980_1 /TAXON_ID=218684 /ORGANISM="Corethron pennatum, Strain L29A3" /LENGTH=58 /DNA_ID=CAMNT_0039067873 /DNA_START=129 /DNA_END=302 /DNA_ORIENTATION=-
MGGWEYPKDRSEQLGGKSIGEVVIAHAAVRILSFDPPPEGDRRRVRAEPAPGAGGTGT